MVDDFDDFVDAVENMISIDTAPKDGTPVLTEEGYCLYSKARNGWFACTNKGDIVNDECPVFPELWREV